LRKRRGVGTAHPRPAERERGLIGEKLELWPGVRCTGRFGGFGEACQAAEQGRVQRDDMRSWNLRKKEEEEEEEEEREEEWSGVVREEMIDM